MAIRVPSRLLKRGCGIALSSLYSLLLIMARHSGILLRRIAFRIPGVERLSLRRRSSSLKLRHVIINVLVGLGIALIIAALHHADVRWIQEAEDNGIDWMMRMQRGALPGTVLAPYAFVDIDERTQQHLGEPYHLPRDVLQKLIDYASDGGARAIVVDFDLSRPGVYPDSDRALVDYLGSYRGPPLILARSFRSSLKDEVALPEVRTSSLIGLEALVAESPDIHWASTLFNREADGVIRRWRLWEAACRDGEPVMVPSIQLLVAGVLHDAANLARIKAGLKRLSPRSCAAQSSEQAPEAGFDLVGMRVEANHGIIGQRIVYTLPRHYEAGERSPMVEFGGMGPRSLLSLRSALPLIQDNDVSAAWLSGHVAMIGASHNDSRDSYPTPLGDMPGAQILLNAIHSLASYGQMQIPPLWVVLTIEVLLIVLMTLALSLLNSFWGMVLSGLGVILLLLPVSFYFFKFGVWVDFAIPLVAVQLHEMAARFEEKMHKARHA